MPKVPNKTLRGYDGREKRNRNFDKCSTYHYDRLPRINNNSYNGNMPRISVEALKLAGLEKELKKPWVLTRKYTRGHPKMTINLNNNKQDINKDTQPESDKRVNDTRLKDKLPESNCYKIIISDGHKYTKDYIINNLLNYAAPETLVPIKYRANEDGANFFVDDKKVAAALLHCEITANRGQKLTLKVTKPPLPRCTIDDEFKERVKQVIMKRYIPATKSIDLSRIHTDFDLISDYFCALLCPLVLDVVFNVLSEHMPDLEALNLNRNILDIDLTLRMVKLKLLKLRILHIGNNSIRDMEELNAIKDLELEELILTGNPICKKYQSTNDYIKDVQRWCPALLRLDGMDLQKPVLCDVVNEGNNVTASERIFAANVQAQQFTRQFLQKYFLIFDSENRERLLTSYTKDACFSMTPFDPHNLMDDRNLCGINYTDDRQKLVKQGRWPIVAFFYKMPKTSHYSDTLTINISLIAEGMTLATVAGMFKELDEEEEHIRYFNRTFKITFEGGECGIKNEELYITQPTDTQLKQLDSEPEIQKTDSDVEMTDSEAQLTDL